MSTLPLKIKTQIEDSTDGDIDTVTATLIILFSSCFLKAPLFHEVPIPGAISTPTDLLVVPVPGTRNNVDSMTASIYREILICVLGTLRRIFFSLGLHNNPVRFLLLVSPFHM